MAAPINIPGRPAPPKPISRPGRVRVVRALYNYNAQHSDELSFNEGDLLYVNDLSHGNQGQVLAECGNKKGWIPSSYVQEQVEEICLPLHDAARRGNISFLQECLAKGISSTGLDSAGNTALYWASRSGHIDCVYLLLEQSSSTINAQNKMGDTPLHVAANHGHLDIVNMLIEKGSDITLKNNAGFTAEEIANDSAVKNTIQLQRHINSDRKFHEYDEDEYNDESD